MSHTPAPHSLIGASAMPRLIACPASFGLSQQVPGGGTSIHAATGTVAHALAEEAIRQGYDPVTQLDETVTFAGYDITVTLEMVAAVRIYIDEVRRRAAGAAWFALETRVVLDPYWTPGTRPSVSAFGTADTLAYHLHRRHLDVVDYKNGAGVYVAASSAQLHYYAAGAMLAIIAKGYPAPVTVDLTIVQPNVGSGRKVRTYPTSALDVLLWVDDVLKPTIAEAMAPGARIAAGAHCRFCPARDVCPALADIRLEQARRDFDDDDPSTSSGVRLVPDTADPIGNSGRASAWDDFA